MAALGFGAVVLHVERGDLSDIWPFRHDDAAMCDVSPIDEAAPLIAHDDTSDADIAFMLQAVSDNLQRNDLVAAKVLLDAVLDVHKDLPQALALQQELNVREMKARRWAASARTTAMADAESAENTAAAATKAGLAPDRPADARSDRTVQHKKPLAAADKTHDRPRRTLSAEPRHQMATVGNGRPKTRAEVVAELRRARVDGTMPNFGGRHP